MKPGDYVVGGIPNDAVFWVHSVIDGCCFRALAWRDGALVFNDVRVFTYNDSFRPATDAEIQQHVFGVKPKRVIGYGELQALLEDGILEKGSRAEGFAKRIFQTFQRLSPEAQDEWCAAVQAVKAEEEGEADE